MARRRSHLILVCFTLAACGISCIAQTITIRVINGKNGHPLAKQNVLVSLLYDQGGRGPAHYRAQIELVTDNQGEAHFELPEPPPAHLAASARIDGSRWACACNLLGSSTEIIQMGVVKCPPKWDSCAKPRPAEILFVARPLSLMYRLLGPLEKD